MAPVIRNLVIGIITSIIAGKLLELINRLIANYYEVWSSGNDLAIAIQRPGGYIGITIFWIIFVFILYSVVYLVPSLTKRTRIKWMIRVPGLFILALALVAFINLTIPARVGSSEVIQGTVTRRDYKYCLLVKPVTFDQCWVQNTILPDHQGNWEALAYFGGYGHFEIILVAEREGFDFPCQPGYTLPCEEIARYENRISRRVIRVD
ncbi:MAG: hypothetical protein Q8M92_01615 [Candidatus Subteraquimicrobiales bacterium]|nr:hypothetical protein [Candidatus Subteraquimicrobiales bacterium]